MRAMVRTAVMRDLRRIQDIIRAAYEPYEQRIGRKPAPVFADYEALIRDQHAFVAEDQRKVCGVIVLIAGGASLLLQNVAVDPTRQRLGVGTILLEFAERVAIDLGYNSIDLYTNELMTENIRLYSRRGYRETHRKEDDGFRRVYMSKQL